MLTLAASPISPVKIDGRTFYIKRDDLLHPQFSGNKARKLYSLLQQEIRPGCIFYGYGSAQANSLYSLAALAKLKKTALYFYVRHIPNLLKKQPSGNYQAALALGATIIEAGEYCQQQNISLGDYVQQQAAKHDNSLFIPEGGRSPLAQVGVHRLAQEIETWRRQQQLEQLVVMLPSGTGTTALYIQQYCVQQQLPIRVWTCACVGDNRYLRQQFSRLESNDMFHPRVLNSRQKFHFGKLYPQHLTTWQNLGKQSGIEFELLYDPIAWQCLLSEVNTHPLSSPVLYIHQGGLLGNQSMLPRYQRKYPQLFCE